MSDGVPVKLLQAQCRQLLEVHYDVLNYIMREIEAEVDNERIESEDSFGYAKKTIRRQSIKEGLTKLRQKINSYADGENK